MKKIIIILAITLISTGCDIYVEENQPIHEVVVTSTEEIKPLTKQVCDILGFMSSEIIEEQAQQGYTFTGRTRGFWCENLLNFQLKEGN